MGRDVLVARACGSRVGRVSGGTAGFRTTVFMLTPVERPGKPKGVCTHRGYMTSPYITTKWGLRSQGQDTFFCTADIGWVTGTATSSTAALERRHVADVRGRSELSRLGSVLAAHRKAPRQRSSTRRRRPSVRSSVRATNGLKRAIYRACACWARSASPSIRKRGSGIGSTSAASRCPDSVDTWGADRNAMP
jgi:hypothetical protein